MSVSRSLVCAACGACLSLLTLALSGCSLSVNPTPDKVSVAGNWQVSAAQNAGLALPSFSGALSGTNYAMTGILHASSAASCIAPSDPFTVSGKTDAAGNVTLTSKDLAGGQLTLTGVLSADGRSIRNASYTVAGGACAMARAADATAQQYAPVNGTYNGTFADSDGQVIAISATFTQTTPDANGNYQLVGSGTFPQNPCFTSPVQATSTLVTGNSFTFTYTDASTNSVTANGTLSTDGSTLTVTSWTLSGPCGPDSGTGLLQN